MFYCTFKHIKGVVDGAFCTGTRIFILTNGEMLAYDVICGEQADEVEVRLLKD